MILKRYCIDCGKIEPPEGAKCCPDSRVFWVEKEAAERINATNHASLKTFEGVVAECHQLKARLAEFGDGHPEWMKRIQRERKEERERIIALLTSQHVEGDLAVYGWTHAGPMGYAVADHVLRSFLAPHQ